MKPCITICNIVAAFKQLTTSHVCPYSNRYTSLSGNHDSSCEYQSAQ